MATAVGDLVVRFGAQTTQFDRKMRSVRRQVTGAGTATLVMGRTMAAGFGIAATGAHALTAALAPILGPIVGVYGFFRLAKSGEEFNRAMRGSLAIMGDVSQALRKDMREATLEAARSTRFAASEAAEAFYFLASAGLNAERSIGALPVVARFAQAGNFDLARATDILTDAQSALGLASKDTAKYMTNMNRVSDVTVAAASKANASVEQFGEALMNKGALGAKLVGMELEEAMAILMVFADKGFAKGVEGGQALWMALRDLKTKAVENQAAFKRLGIDVDAGGGKFANMADIVANLDKAFAGLAPLEVQKKLGALGLPSKSLAPILTLLGEADNLRKFAEYLKQVGGTAQTVADKQLTPLQKGLAKLGAAFTRIGADIVMHFGPSLETAFSNIANWLEGTWKTITFTVRNFRDLSSLALIQMAERFLDWVPWIEKPLQQVAGAFAGTFAGIGAFFDSMIENMKAGLMALLHYSQAISTGIVEAFIAITQGDFANVLGRSWARFQEALARPMQGRSVISDPVKAFGDAYINAAGEVVRGFQLEGGLSGLLEQERKRLLDAIGRRELGFGQRQKEIEAGLEQRPGEPGGGPGAPVSGETKYAGAVLKDTQEAWDAIIRSMGRGKGNEQARQEKIMKETAKNTRDIAAFMERWDREGTEMIGIMG